MKSLENGPGNPYNQPMPGTPEKAAAVKASEKAREKKLRPGQGARLTAAEAREWKAAREARQAVRDAEYARRDAEIEAEVRAKFAKQDAEEAAALQRAAGEKTMSREVARSLLLHDPDYLGDITNAALVDLLEDESVAAYHGRIRAELTTERGLTEKVS